MDGTVGSNDTRARAGALRNRFSSFAGKRRCLVVLFLLLLMAPSACGQSAATVCEPGETQECLCIGGIGGVQVCNSEGSGWGECKGCPDTAAQDALDCIQRREADSQAETAVDIVAQDLSSEMDWSDRHASADVCTSTCAARAWECGVVCGKSCGECAEDRVCEQGLCTCKPDCAAKECGDDGCGGSCGECGDGALCQGGKCYSPVWTDPATGLTWQNWNVQDACNLYTWPEAVGFCESLDDGRTNDWRLPDIDELRSLVRGCPVTVMGGPCGVSSDCGDFSNCWDESCNGCPAQEGPGVGGMYWPAELHEGPCNDGDEESRYWSSSHLEGGGYWFVAFDLGAFWFLGGSGNHTGNVRCVR